MSNFLMGDAGTAYRDWGKPEIDSVIQFQRGQSLHCVHTPSDKKGTIVPELN
jgi:hypothetical protein